ncbi:DUF5005 domain-containing protein [Gracilimonas mengyeensis]|uniref:DUF4185 domain-containing protein n=1 Tax=Gracilimonas mengyeensis TaxID=1302730 RepID=A0A521F0R2_9BACT|nr:DUF5005 domain-containing protein [Gracilimonas mengyeensis]SMO89040.1 protein of unknown function [Gracilimonas mengyeensis]
MIEGKKSLFPAVCMAILLSSLVLLSSCQPKEEAQKVHADESYNTLFTRSGDGLTGADGTYSVLLPDGRTLWIFGDTFLGTVNPDSTRKRTDPMYIRNAFVVQDGMELTTLYNGDPAEFNSIMIPPEVVNSGGAFGEDSLWYWPGDAFVDDQTLNVFVSKFSQDGDGMWDFGWKGAAVVRFSLPDFKQTEIIEIPAEKLDGIHFGHAVFEDSLHTYIYGLRDGKPYAARFTGREAEAEWEYFSDGQWVPDVTLATPVLDTDGSEQFSVIELEGVYYLITQRGGFSNEVWAYHASQPYGWSSNDGKRLFTIEIPFDNTNLFTYNALAHPQFINDRGEILISYNMNSHRLQDHFENAHIYKPRFMRVPTHQLK